MTPLLRINNLSKAYGENVVLDGIDLEVDEGEVVAVLGPSGSGKSTMLRCINCLEWADGGSIHLGEELIGFETHKGQVRRLPEARLAEQRRRIQMVFQNFNLFPNLTALENITEGPVGVLRRPRQQAQERGLELLRAMKLEGRDGAYPRQLSGGQQQRVAIARALAMDPALILFDEPTSALDPETVGEVRDVMRQVATSGMTMVVVTHEINFAAEMADRVVIMEGGVILEQARPEEVLRNPRTERARAFLQRELRATEHQPEQVLAIETD